MSLFKQPLVSAYREDIDGLRAIAIIGVVIFHTFPNIMPGGFIGVDIFFVISGFLISNIILGQINKNNFSLLTFYFNRIRRIFPALITVFLSTLCIGYLILSSSEYAALAKSILYASAFLTNLLLYQETGYFDLESASKILLNLWSLSIEEHFYLIWPLLLSSLLIKRVVLIYCIFLSSIFLSIFLTYKNRDLAFYFSPSRFWELMLGFILPATIQKSTWLIHLLSRSYVSILALLGCLLPLFFFSQKTIFPGFYVFIPTLSTAFLLTPALKSRLIQAFFRLNLLLP